MNQRMMTARVAPEAIFGMMGIQVSEEEKEAGVKRGFGTLAWLMIQDQAAGQSLRSIAEKMKVSEEDLEGLRDSVTGLTGEESVAAWMRGILCIQAIQQNQQYTIQEGWDAIESMAVNKLANKLASMTTDGNVEDMLAIAKAANSAIRRGKGEQTGRGGSRVGITIGDTEVDLKTGDFGIIQLNLSPAVRQQISESNRIIDVTPHRVREDGHIEVEATVDMLSLREIRVIGDAEILRDSQMAESKKETESASKPKFDLSRLRDALANGAR